jgi:hypothetical protein
VLKFFGHLSNDSIEIVVYHKPCDSLKILLIRDDGTVNPAIAHEVILV